VRAGEIRHTLEKNVRAGIDSTDEIVRNEARTLANILTPAVSTTSSSSFESSLRFADVLPTRHDGSRRTLAASRHAVNRRHQLLRRRWPPTDVDAVSTSEA
jgi:hypothetical protein